MYRERITRATRQRIAVDDSLIAFPLREKLVRHVGAGQRGEEAVPGRRSTRENHVARYRIPADKDF
jgi:hypothetical protein